MAKPRIKFPKTAKAGDVVLVKTMISHGMETGLRPNKKKPGEKVPRKIINSFSAKFNGKDVFSAVIYPSTSANPYFAFNFKAMESGEMVFSWREDKDANDPNGEVITAKKSIKVG